MSKKLGFKKKGNKIKLLLMIAMHALFSEKCSLKYFHFIYSGGELSSSLF